MRRAWAVVGALVVVSALAVPAEAKAAKLPRVVRTYMKALARGTPAGSATAVRLSVSGSNAKVYSRAFGGLTRAAVDSGQPLTASTVRFNAKKPKAKLCQASGATKVCVVFADFKVVHGKVADFTRNGESLTGQLSEGDGTSHDALGSTLRVVGAYQNTPGNLLVSVAVKNGPAPLSFSDIGTYIGPDGHQTQSSSATMTPGSDLRPGSSATLAFLFPNTSPGGSVVVKCANPTTLENAETQMPVPVFTPSNAT